MKARAKLRIEKKLGSSHPYCRRRFCWWGGCELLLLLLLLLLLVLPPHVGFLLILNEWEMRQMLKKVFLSFRLFDSSRENLHKWGRGIFVRCVTCSNSTSWWKLPRNFCIHRSGLFLEQLLSSFSRGCRGCCVAVNRTLWNQEVVGSYSVSVMYPATGS